MDTYSEEFRMACFARWLLTERTLGQRRAYLAKQESAGIDTSPIKAALLDEHAKLYTLEADKPAPLSEHEQRKAGLRANRESYARLASDDLGRTA